MSLDVSEIVNIVVALLFAISEILPFIRNTEANGVIDFIRIFCTYLAIKLSRAFGVQHEADHDFSIQESAIESPPPQSTSNPAFAVDYKS